MTDLTFAILKYAFLIGLWLFVWLTVRAIHRDVEELAPRRASKRSQRAKSSNRDLHHMVAVDSATPVVVPLDNSYESNSSHNSHQSPYNDSTQRASGSSRNTSAPAVLTIIDGPLSGTTTPLAHGPITLGRASDNTLILNDEFVSSHHARVFLDVHSGQWAVEDLQSTNGTKVAGQPIHSTCLLAPGVPVRIGATTFELR